MHVSGTPQPDLQWFLNGIPVRKDSRHSIGKDGSLTIRRLNVNDEGMYSATASNAHGSASCKAELFVESKFAFLKFKNFILHSL